MRVDVAAIAFEGSPFSATVLNAGWFDDLERRVNDLQASRDIPRDAAVAELRWVSLQV